jgi:hypothetical protein
VRILVGHDDGRPDSREPVIQAIASLVRDWEPGQPDSWENWTIPQYLEAMGAWLEVYERAYINRGETVPTDGWGAFAAALRAAAVYE